jgi:hypothetical protein
MQSGAVSAEGRIASPLSLTIPILPACPALQSVFSIRRRSARHHARRDLRAARPPARCACDGQQFGVARLGSRQHVDPPTRFGMGRQQRWAVDPGCRRLAASLAPVRSIPSVEVGAAQAGLGQRLRRQTLAGVSAGDVGDFVGRDCGEHVRPGRCLQNAGAGAGVPRELGNRRLRQAVGRPSRGGFSARRSHPPPLKAVVTPP